MKRFSIASCLVFFVATTAWADEPAPPISDKAPPASAKPKTPPKAAPPTEEAKTPFDVGELGPIDPRAAKAIEKLAQECVASPFARDGMDARQEAKCNAAVSGVVAQGTKGASAIFAALNDQLTTYYARDRLFFALSKMDDEVVRDVTIRGMARINTDKMTAYARDRWQLDETLRSMMGAGPEPALPWEATKVRDAWAEGKANAMAWRIFQRKNEGKTRAEIRKEHLASARTNKADQSFAKSYRAISYLVAESPREAMNAAKEMLKRSDLTGEIRAAFESLQSDAEYRATQSPTRR